MYLSKENYSKISDLVDKAISAYTKQEASKYISELKTHYLLNDYEGNVSIILSQLIGYVEAAAGQVQNKEFYIANAKKELYKLQSHVQK